MAATGSAVALSLLALGCGAGSGHRIVATDQAQSNKVAAQQDAGHLLGALTLPSGATQSATEPSGGGSVLARPGSAPASPNLVDRHQWWTVGGTPASVLSFIDSHRPAGSQRVLTSSGTADPNGPSFRQVGYQWPPVPGVLGMRWLVITAVAVHPNETALRVDAEVIWISPRPASETIPPGVKRIDVDVTRFSSIVRGPVEVRSRAKIGQIVSLLNALPLFQPGAISCPADFGVRVNLTFYRSSTRTPLAHASANIGGCSDVQLTIGGRTQPTLAGGPSPAETGALSVVPALGRILGMKLSVRPTDRNPFHTFRGSGLKFSYPANWHLLTDSNAVGSFSMPIAYLSNMPLHGSPPGHLHRGSILVSWMSTGEPVSPPVGHHSRPIRVGGRRGTLAVTHSSCGIAAEEQMLATIPRTSPHNYFQLRACLRGPGIVELETQVMDLLESARISG